MDKQRKAIFLDRDGVLISNQGHYYIWKPEDMELNPGVLETLSELQGRGYLLVVITNQGGISKGLYTREDVDELHRHLREGLRERDILLETIYYCPHHDKREACLCRKPSPLMIKKAMARFGIRAEESWMVGDAARDVESGKAAGLRTLLVEPNGDLRKILAKIP